MHLDETEETIPRDLLVILNLDLGSQLAINGKPRCYVGSLLRRERSFYSRDSPGLLEFLMSGSFFSLTVGVY